MYYPSNFPRDLEPHLITLLLKLQTIWENAPQQTLVTWRKHLRKVLQQKEYVAFGGKTPPYWWFQFMMGRHKKLLNPDFVSHLESTLIKTKVRSISGIVPLTLFTKGVACPFNCIYCPSEPNVPKSYLSDEPAVMRAIRSHYDPLIQTQSRLIMFALSGHSIDKIEIIIKGGTFSFLPKRYRTFFLRRIFQACNNDTKNFIDGAPLESEKGTTLSREQTKNEKAPSRIIGVNIETRPDYITPSELIYLRRLGVTHVEIGVQTLFDDVYTKIKRGHTVKSVVTATRLLKDAGFKVGYHFMLNLPGSSKERDAEMLKMGFTDEAFKPDHIKLYPTTITKFTRLADEYKKGAYVPYPLEQMIEVILDAKKNIFPVWVRIGRLTRDITTIMMEAQLFPPNLREVIQKRQIEEHIQCQCIRCREIQLHTHQLPITTRITEYTSSGGREYFIEKIDAHKRCLGFIRLRFPSYLYDVSTPPLFKALENAAIIRELHIYGKSTPLGGQERKSAQHKGWGEELLARAEEIVRSASIPKLAVISGVGVREYYRRKGYKLQSTYMIKKLKKSVT